MKKYKPSTFNKTISLIIITHLLFFTIIVLLYFRVLNQEESLIQQHKLFSAGNTKYEIRFHIAHF